MEIQSGLVNLEQILISKGVAKDSEVFLDFIGWKRRLYEIEENLKRFTVLDVQDQSSRERILRELDRISLKYSGKAFFELCTSPSGNLSIQHSNSSMRGHVILLLDVEFNEFTSERKETFISQLAFVIQIAPEQIAILHVAPGSILVTIELPQEIIPLLYKLDKSNKLKELGVISVIQQSVISKEEISRDSLNSRVTGVQTVHKENSPEAQRMAGITSKLLNSIRNTLLRCDEFASQRQLNAIFAEQRLKTFQPGLPEGNSRGERVDLTISYLSEKNLASGEYGLVLLLELLSERRDRSDSLHNELKNLANELFPVLHSKVNRQTLRENSDKEILSLNRQLAQLKRNLMKVQEKKALFVDPRSAPPDLDENENLLLNMIADIEDRLRKLSETR